MTLDQFKVRATQGNDYYTYCYYYYCCDTLKFFRAIFLVALDSNIYVYLFQLLLNNFVRSLNLYNLIIFSFHNNSTTCYLFYCFIIMINKNIFYCFIIFSRFIFFFLDYYFWCIEYFFIFLYFYKLYSERKYFLNKYYTECGW